MRRFNGTFAAFFALLLVAAVYVWVTDPFAEGLREDPTPELFRFEKEDLVGIEVVRPDATVALRKVDAEWVVVGESWRPSRSMVRRVAHQIHDLTARAVVAENPEDFTLYGVGEGAIQVTLDLADGRQVKFLAGDPNPTSVSWYVRPIPGEAVFVVKKAAVDYYRLSLEEFRERRFAWLDADEADRIESEIDGRKLAFHRTGPRIWRMTEPAEMDAAIDEIRTMLGRTGALKASSFVKDQPEPADLAPYGLESPEGRVRIAMSGGETITLLVGSVVPGSDPQERYVLRVEDDAIYTARDGFLEAFTLPLDRYRNRDVLGRHEWDVQGYVATKGGESIAIERTSDGWRWPDGAAVPGSTPARVAGRAAEIEAKAFHDPGGPASAGANGRAFGLDPPFATVELRFEEGSRTVFVGAELEVDGEKRRYTQVDGDPVVYEVDAQVASVIEDLFREYGRKRERDADKRIREQPD